MIHIGILDDNMDFCSYEHSLIEAYFKETNEEFEISQFTSCESFEKNIQTSSYDILFIDYDLKEKNCYELLDEIQEKISNAFIILVTASDSISVIKKAFEYKVFRYVTKNCIEKDLVSSLDDCMDHLQNVKDYFTISCHDKKKNIAYSDVIGLYSEGHYIIFQLKETNYRIRGTIKDFAPLFQKHHFICAKSNVFINPEHILTTNDNYIVMSNRLRFECSKKGMQNIRKYFLK